MICGYKAYLFVVVRMVPFDMFSYKFRKKLCKSNPNNEAAQMLLNGEKAFNLNSIRDTFPNSNSPFAQ